jgi:hypothetical protein
MTSGQGGDQYPGPEAQPGQGGPPQDWNAPPPQQPYGQPYGQPYPGYAPAPSAPAGQGAPPAMERPTTVRAGIGAFLATLILGLVGSIVTFADIDDLVTQELARSGTEIELTDDVIRSAILIGAVISLIFVALQLLFMWFAWKGHNWARIVLWVIGGLSVLSGLAGLSTGTALGGFLTSLSAFQLLLTIAGIVLLALKPSSEWYRYRSWQRATGQG